jgi:hypothetical protein
LPGDVLLHADTAIEYVYFPDTMVISVVAVYENGDIIEMATIGREAFSGFQSISNRSWSRWPATPGIR